VKKPVAKKAPAKKAPVKKAPAKKAPVKKAPIAKKPAPKAGPMADFTGLIMSPITYSGASCSRAASRQRAGEAAPVSLLAEDAQDPRAFEVLRRRQLIDYDTSGAEQAVRCAHGWVREAALRVAPPAELRAVHLRLADRLIAAGAAPERVVSHLRAGNDRDRLRGFALAAATRAESRLDFRRAAEFLELAVDVAGDAAVETALRLAENLQRAGRGRRAGERYEALARRLQGTELGERREQRPGLTVGGLARVAHHLVHGPA
jgi:hypothetical protein